MNYTPMTMYDELDKLLAARIKDPVLILGESGVGKSAIVKQVAAKHEYAVSDVRWGQLAPVDARGVPVVDREKKHTECYPPAFWPRTGPGIIFLDEFNMASTMMMGLGQQLLLDRRFGDYRVPDDVVVWAAGNRKIDRAMVNDVPAPVQNRVAHYVVEHDLDSWKTWAFASGIDTRIIGFLQFRPELLHKFNPDSESMAWPSPRTWEMAHRRLSVGMDLDPVVGDCAVEFSAYLGMMNELPNVQAIAEGRGAKLKFPEEPSIKFACVSGLISHSIKEWSVFKNCLLWLLRVCGDEPEWIQNFVMDMVNFLKREDKKKAAEYMSHLNSMPEAARWISEYVRSISAARA